MDRQDCLLARRLRQSEIRTLEFWRENQGPKTGQGIRALCNGRSRMEVGGHIDVGRPEDGTCTAAVAVFRRDDGDLDPPLALRHPRGSGRVEAADGDTGGEIGKSSCQSTGRGDPSGRRRRVETRPVVHDAVENDGHDVPLAVSLTTSHHMH